MLERDVEDDLKKKAKAAGIVAYKFTSPARRNVPDDILLAPIPEHHRAIVARYIQFVECKSSTGKPTSGQEREHQRLRDLGFVVRLTHGTDNNDEIINSMG